MKIYVASSWRNERQPFVLAKLREAGHEVYDFKDPTNSFRWSDIDPDGFRDWTPQQFKAALEHPLAQKGFESDMRALENCDACVLLLPCGKSAHLELGYAVGARKMTLVLMEQSSEPELMYLMVDEVCLSVSEVLVALCA